MANPVSIEIVSDMVCPWCYVGKRRLEKALAERPDLDVQVTWQPFQLSPDMPREGKDRVEYYQQLFGEERAGQIMSSMKDTGVEEGIAFDTKPGARSPNTLAAHALMLMAQTEAGVDQNDVVERLFDAHHVACKDIGDLDVLVGIAADLGLDADKVREQLSSGQFEPGVQGLIQESVERGVSGVPFFIINNRFGLSGAQPAESLIAAIDQIAAEPDSSSLSE
jgi:predicted DsbA family dithiol-disulfide isomerase